MMVARHLCRIPSIVCQSVLQTSRITPSCIKDLSKHHVSSLVCGLSVLDVSRRFSSISKGSPLSPLPPSSPSTLKSSPLSPSPQTNASSSEDDAKREAQWRSMKIGFYVIGASTGALLAYFIYQYGPPQKDENGKIIEDEFMGLPLVQQYSKRIWNQLVTYNKMIKEPSRDKLLPDPVPFPYYQPPYTLLLEFRDLLVHPEWTYNTGWRFKKRPFVDEFFETLNGSATDRNNVPLFEVVIFTSESGLSIAPIIDALDKEQKYFYFKLFRDSTEFIDGHHVKNLHLLNRDLNKVIAVDWNPNSVSKNRENALVVPPWKGNDDDRTLVDLAVFLRTIAVNGVDDVREVMMYYSQFDDPIEAFNQNQIKLREQMKELQSPQVSRFGSSLSSWFKR
uniref:Mitochondrial import inner membrane translocase subunit TIM50 n=1 Tax=Cacopsylla melanoneura TaxID=428564 RepID=A0A8D8LLB5_9HEMI